MARKKKTKAKKSPPKKPMQPKQPKSVADYLAEIADATGGAACIYRGQADASWKLESGAERRFEKFIGKSMMGVGDYHKRLLEDATRLGHRVGNGGDLKDLEMLTRLQHFGAATCLVDFTENALVALFFACQLKKEKSGKNREPKGKVFVLPHYNINKVNPSEDILAILLPQVPLKYTPVMDGPAERRIASQRGIFVINPSKLGTPKIVEVAANEKKDLLKELDSVYQISYKTLFIDLEGFATNNKASKRFEDYEIFFYKGLTAQELGDLDESIRHYTRAIGGKPDFAEAFSNRGNAKYAVALAIRQGLGKTKREVSEALLDAIEDFDKAIGCKPDFSDAYSNRAAARNELGDFANASIDCAWAIFFDSNNASAFYNLGVAEEMLGRPEIALENLKKAVILGQAQNMDSGLIAEMQKAIAQVISKIHERDK